MNSHTLRGMNLLDRHEFRQAIRQFDLALRENPKDAAAYQWRGAAYAHRGNFDQAIKDLSRAIRLDPLQVTAYINRSYAYRSQDDLAHALADITSAVKLEPSDADLRRRRGYIYSRMGEHDKAIADFSAMISLSPRDARGYEQRANEYNIIGEYRKAIADYGSAIRLSPEEPSNYAACAHDEFMLHDYDAAIADYRKAAAVDPSDLRAAYAIANIYKYRGQYGQEISFCKKLQAQHPRAGGAHVCAADGYFHTGNAPAAVAQLSAALKMEPDNPTLYRYRANAELAAERWPQARNDLEKLAGMLPGDAYTNNFVAWILSTHPEANVRDGKAAITFANRACELGSWKNWQSIDTLAAAYAEVGDFAQALKYQQKALALAQGSPAAADVVAAMRRRLRLYQEHKPYHARPD